MTWCDKRIRVNIFKCCREFLVSINEMYRKLLHQIYVFFRLNHSICLLKRWWNINYIGATEHIQGTILYLLYVLHRPDDGCFTAETCSPDVIDISSMNWYTYVVLDGKIHIFVLHSGMAPTKKIIISRLSKSEAQVLLQALISKSDTVFVSRALFISTRVLLNLSVTNFGA